MTQGDQGRVAREQPACLQKNQLHKKSQTHGGKGQHSNISFCSLKIGVTKGARDPRNLIVSVQRIPGA
jgi:hypothetical protein